MCPTAETAQRMLHKEKSSRGVKSLQQHGDGKGSEGCPTSVRGLLCPSVSPSQVFGWQLRSHRDSGVGGSAQRLQEDKTIFNG